MWKLYAKSNEAVAIKTTYKNLVDSLPPNVEIGMVKYFDYEGGWAPPFGTSSFSFACKRASFDHEREVRLILDNGIPLNDNGDPDFEKVTAHTGLDLNIDVHNLIDDIYVAPDTDSWFFDVVKSVKEKYSYSESFNIYKSKLSEVP